MAQNEQSEYVQAVAWFRQDFHLNFIAIVQEAIPYFREPEDVTLLRQQIAQLFQIVQDPSHRDEDKTVWLPHDLLPLLKRVLLAWRRERTADYERSKRTTVNPQLLEGYDNKVRDLDAMLNDPLFSDIKPVKMPQLLDYLTIQKIESLPQFRNQVIERHYDEKFHILQAPDLFLNDLNYYRNRCELRGMSLMIAFLDIDEFKRLNTELGHDAVDRHVLPFFMRCLESHVYNHGYAYRFGGDEYMVLLPNFSPQLGFTFLDQLRSKLGDLSYQVTGRTTVSIGVCYVGADCALTDRELRERAGEAMQYAKAKGRNQIASYRPTGYRDEDLQILDPHKTLS